MEPLPLVIFAANAIAHALDLSKDVDDLVPPIATDLWKQLGLNEKTLLDIFKNVEHQFESACLALNI